MTLSLKVAFEAESTFRVDPQRELAAYRQEQLLQKKAEDNGSNKVENAKRGLNEQPGGSCRRTQMAPVPMHACADPTVHRCQVPEACTLL